MQLKDIEIEKYSPCTEHGFPEWGCCTLVQGVYQGRTIQATFDFIAPDTQEELAVHLDMHGFSVTDSLIKFNAGWWRAAIEQFNRLRL